MSEGSQVQSRNLICRMQVARDERFSLLPSTNAYVIPYSLSWKYLETS